MPALNAQSAILDICGEFSESGPNRKVVPSTPRLSFWAVFFRHNRGRGIRIARLHGAVAQLVQDGGCSHRGTTFGGEG